MVGFKNYVYTTYLSEVFYIERKFAAKTWLFMQNSCHLSLCHHDPMILDGKIQMYTTITKWWIWCRSLTWCWSKQLLWYVLSIFYRFCKIKKTCKPWCLPSPWVVVRCHSYPPCPSLLWTKNVWHLFKT